MGRLLLCFVLFFSSCNTPSSHVSLKVNLGSDPRTLDPRKVCDLQSQIVVQMFFEGLMRQDQNEKPQCALAEGVEVSTDGRIYTFYLREAKWSNGEEITAHDFVYAWKKSLEPSFPSDRAFQLYVLKNAELAKKGKISLNEVGVTALDTKTLRVELEYPVPYFLELLTLPIYFPICQRLDKIDTEWAQSVSSYICNGPFCPQDWRHNDCLEVKKNLNYWDAFSVKLEQIELLMVSGETEFKMYENKKLDWAGSPLSTLPLDALSHIKKKEEFHTKPFLATYFFRINVTRSPFHHSLIRRAFAIAINRQEIVDHVLQGGQIPATGLVPRSMGLQEVPYFKDGDIERAKSYFARGVEESNFSLATLPAITLIYIAGEKSHNIAQTVQDQWKKAFGINIELQPMESKTFYDRISKQDFQLAIGSWTADFNDPLNFLEIFKYKNSGLNNTCWENLRYTELLQSALMTLDANERKKILQESEKILMDEMPIIPLFHYTMLYLANEKVQGVILSNLGNVDFKNAYIIKSEK